MISILIPCYNVEKYLSQCLDSVINQTYRDLQIILVDDGSKDNTWSILQEYAAKDSRIEIYHQENQGVASARNHLLTKIKGDYFLFVDSDDWIEPDMVEFLVKKAQTNNADMVTCGVVKNENTVSNDFEEKKYTQEQAVKEFLRHVSFNGSLCNKLINISLLHNEPRFHHGISYGEDALFCWELLKTAKVVVYTDCQLYHYRMNNESISHSNWSPTQKGTGHIVWDTIAKDCKVSWPQYYDIVRARYAIEDMWCLYFAMKSNYKYDDYIQMLQQHVKDEFPLIVQSRLVSSNKILFAWISIHFYKIGCKFRRFMK